MIPLLSALSSREPNGSARKVGVSLEKFKEELLWDLLVFSTTYPQ